MAFDISTLPAYTDQTGAVVSKSVFAPKTASVIAKMPGVKGSKTVNVFDQPVTFQSDACGFTAIDSTPLTQRTLTVGAIKSDKSYCPHTIDGIYAQIYLVPGSYQTTIPFEQQILDLEAKNVAAQLETALWQGDLSSGSANLNKFDGLLKIITGATSASGVTQFTGNTFTTSTGMTAVVDTAYLNIPAQIRTSGNVALFIGVDAFVLYIKGLRDLNLFHFDPTQTGNFEIAYPADPAFRIYGVNGLNGTQKGVVARTSNLIYGFDLESDSAGAQIWYSRDNNEVRSTIRFKAGTQIAIPSEILYLK